MAPAGGAEHRATLGGMTQQAAEQIRLRIDLAYDGTNFAGWARQPGQRTVQGVLESAITTALRLAEPARLTVAGRTDAGVHAAGQVAHLDVPRAAWQTLPGRSSRSPAQAFVHRINGLLAQDASPRGSGDVLLRAVTLAPEHFDARFAAVWRRYSYRVADAASHRDPRRRHYELWHRAHLDVQAMNVAAAALLGEHDFLGYCKPRPGATTIRSLQDFTWRRREDDGGVLVAELRADAFCHSMVRSLVGACLAVGQGHRDVSWPARVLAAARRDSAVQVAPAHGLTLEEVAYPPAEQLADRVAAARNLRRLPPTATTEVPQ